jgi:hypothetical protein
MARRLRAAVIAIVIGALVAGCGNGGDGGDPPGPGDISLPPELATVPDPCTLVTTEEASAALGKQTKPCEVLGQDDFYAQSRFLPADENLGSVTVDIESGGRARYDAAKQDAAVYPEFAELSGIGDAAYFVRPAVDAKVAFLRGPYVVYISVGFVTGPPASEKATTLAQQAASRLSV